MEYVNEIISEVIKGSVHGVEELMESLYSAYIDDLDVDGRSPIMYAVMLGHIEIAKILLENGATLDTYTLLELEKFCLENEDPGMLALINEYKK